LPAGETGFYYARADALFCVCVWVVRVNPEAQPETVVGVVSHKVEDLFCRRVALKVQSQGTGVSVVFVRF